MTFEQLREAMPDDVQEAFDPLTHKTATDLAWLCWHLIDLSTEGELDIDRNAVEKFRDKCGAYVAVARPYLD